MNTRSLFLDSSHSVHFFTGGKTSIFISHILLMYFRSFVCGTSLKLHLIPGVKRCQNNPWGGVCPTIIRWSCCACYDIHSTARWDSFKHVGELLVIGMQVLQLLSRQGHQAGYEEWHDCMVSSRPFQTFRHLDRTVDDRCPAERNGIWHRTAKQK